MVDEFTSLSVIVCGQSHDQSHSGRTRSLLDSLQMCQKPDAFELILVPPDRSWLQAAHAATSDFIYVLSQEIETVEADFFLQVAAAARATGEEVFLLGGSLHCSETAKPVSKAYVAERSEELRRAYINGKRGTLRLPLENFGGPRQAISALTETHGRAERDPSESEFFTSAYLQGYKLFHFPDLSLPLRGPKALRELLTLAVTRTREQTLTDAAHGRVHAAYIDLLSAPGAEKPTVQLYRRLHRFVARLAGAQSQSRKQSSLVQPVRLIRHLGTAHQLFWKNLAELTELMLRQLTLHPHTATGKTAKSPASPETR